MFFFIWCNYGTYSIVKWRKLYHEPIKFCGDVIALHCCFILLSVPLSGFCYLCLGTSHLWWGCVAFFFVRLCFPPFCCIAVCLGAFFVVPISLDLCKIKDSGSHKMATASNSLMVTVGAPFCSPALRCLMLIPCFTWRRVQCKGGCQCKTRSVVPHPLFDCLFFWSFCFRLFNHMKWWHCSHRCHPPFSLSTPYEELICHIIKIHKRVEELL